MEWRDQDGLGTLIATTNIRHPYELYFRERAPWKTGLVRLKCGATIIAFLHSGTPTAPCPVRIGTRLDRAGQAVLIALPEKDTTDMSEDPLLRELGNAPMNRKVLVTDGGSQLGGAVVEQVIAAGAEIVWVGISESWKSHPDTKRLAAIPQVALLPLDLTNTESVETLASQIGGKVDILINTAEFHRTHSIMSRRGVETARAEMEINYFGLLRLAQAFGPAMGARAAEGSNNAVAWVNILSIFALSNYPKQGTFSASKAAAYSLSQSLRAELRQFGLRVLNVFPGPVDEDWNQLELPPKIGLPKLASAIVTALEQGIEDLYPDPVAQDWHERWLADPKVLEMEQVL